MTSYPIQMKSFSVPRWRIKRVIDGDTFEISVNTWPRFADVMSIRIDGIDTAEMRGASEFEKALAQEAKEHLQRILKRALWVRCSNVRRDKFGGRVLASVSANGRCVAKQMISEGLARPYDGGERKPWTRRPRKRSKIGRAHV